MKLNKFIWDIYKESEQGKKTINLFESGTCEDILEFAKIKVATDSETFNLGEFVTDISKYISEPIIPEQNKINLETAKTIIEEIAKNGFKLKYENGYKTNGYDCKTVQYSAEKTDMLYLIPILSISLFKIYPQYFKPYFFRTKFKLLTQIADAFEIELPEIPLKKYKTERVNYYWKLCEIFYHYQEENKLTPSEFCAFLYDFAPKFISESEQTVSELPKPTQVWMVGGDKGGVDMEFLDSMEIGRTSFWQGNEDTKRGDIIIMYCLTPRSYIHSIWRATSDGIADPFFHYYGSIYIGEGKKVAPVTLKELKADDHFSKHPLVRKNLQGLNGYAFTSDDYQHLLKMIINNGGNTQELPQPYSPAFSDNENLNNEREVELTLIEPFLHELGYTDKHWVRQLSVRMGRGERNFPDYVFLTQTEKNYEEASMLIEAKYWIRNNKELEETFKQVWSYGQRLTAKVLVIADKNAIWIYERNNDSFDRTKYIKKYWKELELPDDFATIKRMIGRKTKLLIT
jgi:hypothetical protein